MGIALQEDIKIIRLSFIKYEGYAITHTRACSAQQLFTSKLAVGEEFANAIKANQIFSMELKII
jgi:hypothetical protein